MPEWLIAAAVLAGLALIALVKDEVLYTINSLEILGIIYLAIAVSKLRSDLARLEGRLQQREHDEAAKSGR